MPIDEGGGILRREWLKCLMVIGLLMLPRHAGAQCGMGASSGGGHDHGAAAALPSGESSEKKTWQAIQKLLADPGARPLLMEAVLADRPLVRGLMDRILAVPELRSLAAERLVAAGVGAGDAWSGVPDAPIGVQSVPGREAMTESGSGPHSASAVLGCGADLPQTARAS